MFSKQVIRRNPCYKTHEIAKNTCPKLVAIFPTKISRSKSGCNISNGVAIFPTPLQYFLLQYFQPLCNKFAHTEFLKVQQLIDKQTKVKKNIINLSDSGTTAPPTTTSTTTAAETTSKAPGKY